MVYDDDDGLSVRPLKCMRLLHWIALLFSHSQRIRSIIEDVNMHFLNLVESDKEAKGLDEIDPQDEAMYGSFDPTNNNVTMEVSGSIRGKGRFP